MKSKSMRRRSQRRSRRRSTKGSKRVHKRTTRKLKGGLDPVTLGAAVALVLTWILSFMICYLISAILNSTATQIICDAMVISMIQSDSQHVRERGIAGGLSYESLRSAFNSVVSPNIYTTMGRLASLIPGPRIPGSYSCSIQNAVSQLDFVSFRSYCAYAQELSDPNMWENPEIPIRYEEEVAQFLVAIQQLCSFANAGLFAAVPEEKLVPVLATVMDYLFSFSVCNQGKSYQYLYSNVLQLLRTAFQKTLE